MFKKANWKVLAACMGIAVMFWLLHALGMDYNNIVVDYPVKVVFNFKNKRLDNLNLPKNIQVRVTNRGWDLLRFNILKVKPIVLKVRQSRKLYITRNELTRACKSQIKLLHFNKIVTKRIKLYK